MRDLSRVASGEQITTIWSVMSRLPGGKRVFSKLIGRLAPYTSTIDGRVQTLRPGFAAVRMRDRRSVRNHLDCVHAVALVNLAELTTGLAIMSGLPANGRGILERLEIEYLKKARGTLTGECHCDPPTTAKRKAYLIHGVIKNQSGVVVARAKAHWLIGPKK